LIRPGRFLLPLAGLENVSMETGTDDIRERKRLARRLVRGRLSGMGESEIRNGSAAICRLLAGMPVAPAVRWVTAYVAMAGEVDPRGVVSEFVGRGMQVLLPRHDAVTGGYEMVAVENWDQQVRPGRFGIGEPVPELPAVPFEVLKGPGVLWLVPGLAFDRHGNRLGRGGGFYDRLLADAAGVKIGLAFSCQIQEEVPALPHDVRLDWIVTELEVISCRGESPAGQN
jgi:5-formyltetrahydrofolate cyclo-ligase